MYLDQSLNIIKKNIFTILLSLIPISFIAGNLIINLNIILIILFSLLIYKGEIFKLEYYFFDKVLLAYFLLLIFSAIYNDIYLFKKHSFLMFFETTFKSFLFLKYLFLYFSIRLLFKKNEIDVKFFFITSTLAVMFVCIDIFYQFINGKDIFGFDSVGRKLSGPFGDELIAGSYLQRFSLFTFFLLPLFYQTYSKKYSKFILPIFFSIILISIILSGNRMPFILFIFSVSLVFLFQKQTRKFFFHFIFIFSIIFFLLFNFNLNVKRSIENFYFQVSKIAVLIYEKDFDNKNSPQHLKEFSSFYGTWSLNKYIGGGIKNFRYYCHLKPRTKDSSSHCNMHPHNYYLEILTETGILGFILIIILFLNLIYLTFYRKYFSSSKISQNNFIIPFIFLFITEIFPLKSTGSFFTTGNTTYLFLIMAILISFCRDVKSIENKN